MFFQGIFPLWFMAILLIVFRYGLLRYFRNKDFQIGLEWCKSTALTLINLMVNCFFLFRWIVWLDPQKKQRDRKGCLKSLLFQNHIFQEVGDLVKRRYCGVEVSRCHTKEIKETWTLFGEHREFWVKKRCQDFCQSPCSWWKAFFGCSFISTQIELGRGLEFKNCKFCWTVRWILPNERRYPLTAGRKRLGAM